MLKKLLYIFALCGICLNLSLANATNSATNSSAKAENNASCQKINKFFDAKTKRQNKQSVKIPTH